MSNEKKMLKEFYNYKYWREIQRNQLTTSSNVFFTFSTVILGFIVNYLLKESFQIHFVIKNLLLLSALAHILSITLYTLFNTLRLVDYKKTANLIKVGTKYCEISKRTILIGKLSWYLFVSQIGLSVLGLSITLFTFYNIISTK
jgi:hypothetical protein